MLVPSFKYDYSVMLLSACVNAYFHVCDLIASQILLLKLHLNCIHIITEKFQGWWLERVFFWMVCESADDDDGFDDALCVCMVEGSSHNNFIHACVCV